jgi:hypothetical protein
MKKLGFGKLKATTDIGYTRNRPTSRIPGYFYTAIEGLGPKEYSGVVGAAKKLHQIYY